MSASPVPVTSDKVCVSPASGSVALRLPTFVATGWFSATLAFDSALSVGASLTLVTVTVNAFWNVPPLPSSVCTRIE